MIKLKKENVFNRLSREKEIKVENKQEKGVKK
jgi:hypothetical protein